MSIHFNHTNNDISKDDGTSPTIGGNEVATTGTVQTFTNKTVNLASNTITGTMAQFDTACSDGNFSYSGHTHVNSTVQRVRSTTSVSSTTTSIIPADNTIPQNTEGTELLTATITPTSSTSVLRVSALLNIGLNAAATGVCAIFRDSGVNAVAANFQSLAAGLVGQVVVVYEVVAGSTAATTFRMRVGPGAAATLTVNGSGGTGYFGGVLYSSLLVEEILQ